MPRHPLSPVLFFVCLGAALIGCTPSPSGEEEQAVHTRGSASQPSLLALFQTAAEAAAAGDWRGTRDAYSEGMEMAPNLPPLIFAIARAEAMLGNREACLEHLETMIRLGASTDLEAEEGFAELLERPEFQDVANRLLANGEGIQPAELVHRIGDAHLWPEGIALDRSTGDLYVGSIKRRAIFRLTPAGEFLELGSSSDDELLEVLGLSVDSARQELWAATGLGSDELQHSGEPRRNELVRYDLKTGKLAGRYAVPDDEHRLLNDVVVAPDGTAWATESFRGELYRVPPGGELELFARHPELYYLNGLDVVGKGSTLLLGAFNGLYTLDTKNGDLEAVRGQDMALGMVDGLCFVDGSVVLVQNSPRMNNRIVLVELDDNLRNATRLEVLPSGLPDGLIPYTCAVGEGAAFIIAGAPFELMEADEPPPEPAVLRIQNSKF